MSPTHLWSSCGCLSFIALLAGCSNDTVNLGGGREPLVVQPGERCSGSAIVQGPVTVHDQKELEQLAGCEQIDGDLHIEVFAGADLRPLTALHRVDGLLEIGAYPDISQVDDLQGLNQEVMQISADGYLSTLTGMEGLQRVSALQIGYVAAEDLEPLFGLRQLSGRDSPRSAGSVSIQYTANLRDLHGLSNIDSVNELLLYATPALSGLGGIHFSVTSDSIDITDSPLLTSLEELRNVGSMSALSLRNTGIIDLDPLDNLTVVGAINLSGNPQLTNIDGLANLGAADSFNIRDNAVLQSIPPLSDVFGIDEFTALHNPKLQSIHLDQADRGLGPDYLRGSPVADPIKLIDIGWNDSLSEVSLSAGLESGRLLAIYENPSLANISLGTLQRLEELDITGNANLTHVDVGALQTVDSLSLINNPKLDPAQLGTVRTFNSLVGGNAKVSSASP